MSVIVDPGTVSRGAPTRAVASAAQPRSVDLGAQRAHQPAVVDPVHRAALPAAARLRHRGHLDGGVARGRALLRPDVRDHRRLPPLLLAPQLPARARPAVRARVRRHDRRAEGPALVGRAPSRASQVLRHRTRHPLADPRLLVEPRRLDPLRQVQQDRLRRDQGLHEVSRAGLARQARLDRAVERSASRAISTPGGAGCSSASSPRRSCCGTRRSA